MSMLRAAGARAAALALLAATAGCGDGTSTSPDGGDMATAAGDMTAGDPNTLVGSFAVRLVPPNGGVAGFTSVVGKVSDGPTPSALLWDTVGEEGGCRLRKPRVPFCNTPCGGSAVCVADDTCQPYPTSKSVGTVTVHGVKTTTGETDITLTAVANTYQPTTTLAYPGFGEGDEISVSSSGGTWAPFTLRAAGVAPLVLGSGTPRLESGKAVALAWTPAGKSGISTIHVKLDISHHGGTKGLLECDAIADAGTLTLPASLVTQLLALGVAGFPTVVVTRRATGSAVIAPGRVDLVISSEVEQAVEIPGLTSCTDTAECPSGQTCQRDLTCK